MRPRPHRPHPILLAAAACLPLALPPAAASARTYNTWIGPSGNWSNPTNWTPSLPTTNSSVTLTNASAGNADITVTFDPAAFDPHASWLYLTAPTAGSVTLHQATGTLSYADLYVASAGNATLDLSGGTQSESNGSGVYVGYGNNSTGTLNLSSTATLSVTYDEWVGYAGGTGSVSQSGGSHSANTLYLAYYNSASRASYSLSAGSLSTPGTGQYVGYDGAASFSHTGGTNSTNTLYLGYNPSATGSYSLSGSAALSIGSHFDVGFDGVGSFTQSGGTVTAPDTYVGARPGAPAPSSYSLSAGSLHLYGSLFLAYAGTASFDQTGGSVTLTRPAANLPADLSLAHDPGSAASYTLRGGSLSIPGNLTVGTAGQATFSQSAGTTTVAGSLSVGPSASLTLTGGSLSASSTSLAGALSLPAGAASLGPVTASSPSASLTVGLSPASPAAVTAQSLTLPSLTLNPGGSLTLSPNPAPTPSTLSSLTLSPGATLDLTNNPLTLTAGAPDAHPGLSQLRQYLHDSLLLSSTAPLGYLLNPSTNIITINPTIRGDANLDGVINADDYALLDQGYASHGTYWWQGDFNYDGVVDASDYLLIDTTLGQAQGFSPGFLAQRESQFGAQYVQQLLTSVPEPASPLACLVATLLLTRRRPRTAE